MLFSLTGESGAFYAPQLDVVTDLKSDRGIFNLSGIPVAAQPGTAVSLKLESLAVPGERLDVALDFRACVAGEEFTDDGRCIACLAGFYSLEAPTSTEACESCPNHGQCFGGDLVSPSPGYWRGSSLTMLPCYNAAACLGAT